LSLNIINLTLKKFYAGVYIMKIKSIFTSMNASFEQMAQKIENHEAVADCVIQDVSKSAAKIRGQLHKVKIRYENQLSREKQLLDDSQRWRHRALNCREKDETKALQCMQSLKNTEKSLRQLQTQMKESQRLADDLENNLSNVEQGLMDLQSRRESLSARDARNQAAYHVQKSQPAQSAENIFDRWETRTLADEYASTSYRDGADILDQEFRQQENADELRLELEALTLEDIHRPEPGEKEK